MTDATGEEEAGWRERFAALREQYETILQSAGDGIHGLDADGNITFANAQAERILGWKTADVIGRKSHELHHHSHADGSPYPRRECPVYLALRDGEAHHVDDEVFWHADGSAIPVEYTSTPILKDGKPVGAVVVFRDVSERRRLEAQRRKAHEELESLRSLSQLILDSAGEGIYGLDAEGRLLFGNGAAERIAGWKAEALIGSPMHDVHHHSHADGRNYPGEDCPIYAALKDGEVHRVDDEVFWHADGSAIPVEYTSTPMLENGRPVGAVVVFRDVSERRRLEAQREEAFERIKALKDQLEQERDYLRDEINVTTNFGEILGDSAALKHTLAQVEAVAATPASVLILGESGVGKEMVARAIHSHGDRSGKPLVKVNCASIPKDLFESEFFGHVKGAFTGAHRDRVGRLQLADGGTLFLDEVGEIPLSQQGKLLRALQEGEFERVGDERTLSADVRIVAATNRDLAAEVHAGRFREDLYYRLSVFPIHVPPLRERRDDIGPLARHFIGTICKELGREPPRLARRQLDALLAHDWPGNVRELRNVIERAIISSRRGRLEFDLAMPGSTAASQASARDDDGEADFMSDEEIRALEKANMVAALEAAGWQVWGESGAAALLGIKPSTLNYRMRAFGIRKPAT